MSDHKEDDLDLSLDDVNQLWETGEPADIVPPRTRVSIITAGSVVLTGTTDVATAWPTKVDRGTLDDEKQNGQAQVTVHAQ